MNTALERLYSDASFSERTGMGGIAVVAPEVCASLWTGRSFSPLQGAYHGAGAVRGIRVIKDHTADDRVIFCAAFPCSGAQSAEKHAMTVAFLVACSMLRSRCCEKVEIVSDCLNVINQVTGGDTGGDPLLLSMHRLWLRRQVIINKVKAHNGNRSNELADLWAKHARRGLGEVT